MASDEPPSQPKFITRSDGVVTIGAPLSPPESLSVRALNVSASELSHDQAQPLLTSSATSATESRTSVSFYSPVSAPAHVTVASGRNGLISGGANVSPLRSELQHSWYLAWPMILQNLLGYGLTVISIAFLGRLGSEKLSAAVLGTSFYNITGYSIIIGLSSGLETLCGQAQGAKRYNLLGIYLQRALLICFLTSIPIAVSSTMISLSLFPSLCLSVSLSLSVSLFTTTIS